MTRALFWIVLVFGLLLWAGAVYCGLTGGACVDALYAAVTVGGA